MTSCWLRMARAETLFVVAGLPATMPPDGLFVLDAPIMGPTRSVDDADRLGCSIQSRGARGFAKPRIKLMRKA